MNPLPPGDPPGQAGRDGGDARPRVGRPLRVRHRPGRRQPRDPRLPAPHRHRGHHPDPRDLGGRHRRVRQDVDPGRVPGLRGQVLVAAAPQDPAQALEEAAPAHVVRLRQHVELRDVRPQGPRRARLLGRRARPTSTPSSRRTRAPSRTPSRSVRTSTTTSSWPAPACVSEDPRQGRAQVARRPTSRTTSATCSGTTTRSRTPTRSRTGPSSSRRCTPEAHPRDAGRRACIVGDPDHAVEQLKRWEAAGADQFIIGTGWQPHEDALETIRLLGEHVIPKIDPDPVHRTTRMREAAAG